MSLGRKALRRRCELNLIGAPGDDAISDGNAARNPDLVAVRDGDFNIAPSESFATQLHEHIRPSGLEQHRSPWNGGHSNAVAPKQNGRSGLSDQELTARVLDLKVNRQRSRCGIDHPGVVHVLSPEGNRIALAWYLESHVTQRACDSHVRRADLRAQVDAIRTDNSEEWGALIVGGAQRREHIRDPAGYRRPNRESVAGGSATTASERFIPLGESSLRSLQSCFGRRDHPSRILDTARRDSAIGEEPFGTNLFSPCTIDRYLGLGDLRRQRRAIVAGHPRLEASQHLTGAHSCPDRQE